MSGLAHRGDPSGHGYLRILRCPHNRVRPHQDEDERRHEGRLSKRPAAGQATKAQPYSGDPSGRAVPSRPAHHRRASRTVLCRPIDGLSCCPTRRRTWCHPHTVVGPYGLVLVTAPSPAPRVGQVGIASQQPLLVVAKVRGVGPRPGQQSMPTRPNSIAVSRFSSMASASRSSIDSRKAANP